MAQDNCQLNEPIAVIGSGCRFPGGTNSPSQLWNLLKNPKDLSKEVPKERFNVDAFYHPDGTHHGRTNARYAYFVEDDPYAFDANFFNIPPSEADTIDPQHRLLLETVYESISAAGLRMEDLRGTGTAVYVGQMQRDFLDNQNIDLDAMSTYAATGTSASILSNRVSYFFDWHGPSMTIDTACSSSLVAVHHAVQQLRSGSSKVAVAAGSNLILGPHPFILASKLNMFSPTGRSRMWDAGADGYARGEGVAAVVLKPLSQAIADGDPIECIIRESGVNQDGRTPGITMPNASAQEALIREVYARAGLDVSKAADRCQYFEAHGTGTPAGDPQEAQAISSAFFGDRQRTANEEPLYVGSIKTVIGHTEGTAGIAGLMKASQLVQHGLLTPNLLFEELSPRVAPFYQDVRVVTKEHTWPALKFNQPRRVSVNSFGFGGTNAHIIVESYDPAYKQTLVNKTLTPSLMPITLSANSDTALGATMDHLREHLMAHPDTQLSDLSWTLLKKRSNLSVRHTIQAETVESLCHALERDAALVRGKRSIAIASDIKARPQILGIFTGQGAQWPAMGKALIDQVPYAQEIIWELDRSLQSLPVEYRPSWRLIDQLLLEGEGSQVNNAVLAQPLCCAVQIVLTNLLRIAGVGFKAVAGHSSGEIACAFAAGFITASQAIRIAYLRGFTSKLAGGPDGREGAMIAVGTSYEDAVEFCELESFKGRISVAASNAPDSITLSGDKDAILEAEEIFNDESKFARLLKIDKAYHSHHMIPCGDAYTAALKACGCDTYTMAAAPVSIWISSVYEGKIMKPEDLTAEYWKENLLSPVLFHYAVEQALIKHTPLDVAIEVGAHPALKNPSLKTIENCAGAPVPYVGCMERGGNDVEAFSKCLGYIWSRFGSASINVDSLYRGLSLSANIKDWSSALPCYPWDHSRSYRKESRALRSWLGGEPAHLLLGKQLCTSSPSAIQWQNFIRQRDIEWLDGHSLQGQTVFPGAGYVVMVMEAALKLAGSREVQLLEVLNLSIDKAVTFEDEHSLVELNLGLVLDAAQTTDQYAAFDFIINSSLARETGLTSSASGQIAITYGPGSLDALPAPQREPPHLNDVSIDRFYTMLAELGYGYTKQFRGVSKLRRGDSKAVGTIDFHPLEDNRRHIILHPATLDVAFQSFIGAYTAPGDRRLRSLLVPTGIGRIAVNPQVASRVQTQSSQVNFISTSAASIGNNVEGDIEVFDFETQATLIHIEGLSFKPFSPPSAADDHGMFSKWSWSALDAEALLDDSQYHATNQDKEDVAIVERVTYWYIKSFVANLTSEDRQDAGFHFTKYIQWCDHMLAEAEAGRNVWHQSGWGKDTQASIEELIQKNLSHPFIRLIQRVGEGALDTLRSNKNAFDLMDHDGLLTEFYGGTMSYGHSYEYYSELLEQINHRYQNPDVLEIGGGTAGATRFFLNNETLSFNSYTFTDISSAFFEQAAKEFETHADKLNFRSLDIRRDPSEQGFRPNSFDLIIASNVLHATPSLKETLANVRTLLKPGGKLVVIEVAHREHTRIGFIFGLFPDWWSGHDEGRVLEPFISYEEWNKVLKTSGFSGVDSRTLDPDSRIFPNGVFATHAVDALVERLDSPLAAPVKSSYAPMMIVGGSSPKTSELVDKLPSVLPSRRRIDIASTLDQIIDFDLESGFTFVVLSELDQQTFAGLDDERLDALQTLFNAASTVLWITENAWVDNPEQAMTIGLLRTLRMEYPDVQVQVLDVDSAKNLTPELLAETVLRLEDGANWEDAGLLWTSEPELYLAGGVIIVPRLKPDVEKNNRLNSNRRAIEVQSHPQKETLSLEYEDDKHFFRVHEERFIPATVDESFVKVRVRCSLAKALRIGHLGFFHLVHGTIMGSNETVVALTQTNASNVKVSSDQFVTIPGLKESAHLILPSIAAEILAQNLLSDVPSGATILVLEPPVLYVEALIRQAGIANVSIKLVTREARSDGQWTQVHDKETQRSLRRKLPPNVSVFYDLSSVQSSASLGHRLAKFLPSTTSVRRGDYLSQRSATSIQPGSAPRTSRFLARAVEAAMKSTRDYEAPVLNGNEILSLKGDLEINTIIDWNADDPIPSRIRSIETDQIFVNDKTYLLIGLAGDLGRSIARFMIERGACHVVLSSRSPQIDQQWINEVTQLGGNIMVLPMDASKEASVDEGLAKIRSSMPPIAGVAFGPLVLQDVMFKNMDLEMMEMVLAPKVTGARLLNERLSDPANPLDFFVMFSSFVMVSGNPGQAAYSAANAYTHALAQQRRSRGMAGSTIDIGAVFGVGFIARAGREHEYDVVKFIFDEVNEWELHALFAEAVVAGRNRSPESSVEVITGMPYMESSNRERIPYYDDPRFAYFKLTDRLVQGSGPAGAQESVKDQLLEAETISEVREIIAAGLSERVRSALQFSAVDELNLTAPLIDQGVDSLSAVTVGSWFTKNLTIEIPLLKILGGASVADLVEEATSRLSPEAIPLASGSLLEAVQPVDSAQPVESSSPSSDLEGAVFSSDGALTPPTPASEIEPGFAREAPLSITQEYSWKQQQLPLDPSTFNSTIGMYMQGPLNLGRLGWAFDQVLQRNDAFRTCFISDPDSGNAIQSVMKSPQNAFEAIKVADKVAADQHFKDLEQYKYDLAKGDTLKIDLFHWTAVDHLLVVAYHRLVGDGWTTERIFVEVGQLYSGGHLPPAFSYADFAIRQREQLKSGELAEDLTYWNDLFKLLPQRLPLLDVPEANKTNAASLEWTEHEVSARLNPMVAIRIKDRSRKHKATSMHYYLAAFHVLLSRLTSSTDVVVGVADTNRLTLADQNTLGFFANLLPVRLAYDSGMIFNQTLSAVKEQMRTALLHSAVPYSTILGELGLPEPSESAAPLFQAVFDYKQGQVESGSIGDANIVDSRTPRAGSPYDITLEMSDDPKKDPLITVKLQKSRYGAEDAEVVMNAYLSILSIFSRNPALRVADGRLDQGAKARS